MHHGYVYRPLPHFILQHLKDSIDTVFFTSYGTGKTDQPRGTGENRLDIELEPIWAAILGIRPVR